MASTYSNLKIQLMATGENATTWGDITNTNLGTAIEEAIANSADVTFASGDVTLTLTNTNNTQTARNMRLNLTGTTGGSTRNLTVPNIEKLYVINNGCADTVTVKNSTGATLSIPAGKTTWVFSTGTGVVDVLTYVSSLSVNGNTSIGGNLTVTGTGAFTGNVTAPTQANGDNSTKVATTAYVQNVISGTGGIPAGLITLWSGSAATIPSGWVLCNGSNGTPDLRDKFIVGAGSTYAVGATGGSANAIVVSHNHSATSTSNVTDNGHTHSISGYSGTNAGTTTLKTQNPEGTLTVGSVGSATTGITVSTTTTVDSAGSSGTNANLPPYYALCYIMKT